MTDFASAPPRPATGRVPAVVPLLAVLGVVVIAGPVLALAVRVNWSRFLPVLREPATRELLSVTLFAAVQATVVTVAVGLPLALWVNSAGHFGARVVRLLVMLPLAMPPVVGGLALTAAVGRRGLAAPVLDALGVQFAFAFPGVVLAHVFVALPFVVVSVDSALRQIDREILASAAGVGMSPSRVLVHITLPAVAPAVATGAGLAFARSLGEFGTTLTFAGSLPGVTRTMPVGIYLERELDQDRAYVLAAILIVLAVAVLTAALLPAVCARHHTPRPATTRPMDTARMRELTRPDGGGTAVSVTTRGATTTFPAGVVTALVGPNGSGKSTLVGLVAGRLRGAEVEVAGRSVDGAAGRFVPAHRRGIVLLTQRPGLPRTATVEQAVTMATRDRGRSRALLAAAGLEDLQDVPVPALSGGQAAQVALVRALAARPGVLILDEPLAAVDVDSAARWRRLLRAAGADRTTVTVTHDPVDVAGLSDRVVVMDSGRTVSQSDTAQFFALPPTDFAARLAGVNRLVGTLTLSDAASPTLSVAGQQVTGVWAAASAPAAPGHGAGQEHRATPGSAVGTAVATFPPTAVTLVRAGADGFPDGLTGLSARNRWHGRVLSVDAAPADTKAGNQVSVTVALGEQATVTVPVTARTVVDLGLEPGTAVYCLVKATAVTVHPHG